MKLKDFYAYMPMHNYIFAPSREPWPAASVNARIPPIVIGTDNEGEDITIKASVWIDKNQPVEMMTWAPGMPMIITDRLIAEGGWIERKGVACFNLYRPPTIELGDASKAGPWIEHVRKIYPRRRRPHHQVVCSAGATARGQDQPRAGAWERRPGHRQGHDDRAGQARDRALEFRGSIAARTCSARSTGFLRAVILRINEAHDMGDVNRFQFYDHMKAFLAAPPDVLRVNEKHLSEY